MKTTSLPIGLVDTGQTITLPLPVFDELLESDPEMRLATPIIPLLDAVKWFDERVGCRYARRGDIEAAPGCSQLRRDDDGRRTWCAGNGWERKSPCVFTEPENSVVWRRIREQIEIASSSSPSSGQKNQGDNPSTAPDPPRVG